MVRSRCCSFYLSNAIASVSITSPRRGGWSWYSIDRGQNSRELKARRCVILPTENTAASADLADRRPRKEIEQDDLSIRQLMQPARQRPCGAPVIALVT